MNSLKQIFIKQLIIMLCYILIIHIIGISQPTEKKELGIMIYLGLFQIIHLLILFSFGLSELSKDREKGMNYLITFFTLLLIGFSTCYSTGFIY